MAHEFTTANVYDSDPALLLLKQLMGLKIGFAFDDKAYDSKKVREHSIKHKLVFLSPINHRKDEK